MKRLVCLILCSCLPLTALSAPWYRIEMMLIHYSDDANITRETWPLALDPVFDEQPDHVMTQLDWWTQPSDQLTVWNGFRAWPSAPALWPAPLTHLDSLTMTAQAERINRQRDMQVVWHQAWIEPIQTEQTAIVHALRIQPDNAPNVDIQGNVRFYLSRFLHIQTQLTVQHYLPESEASVLDPTQRMSLDDTIIRPLLQAETTTQSQLEHPIRVPLRAAQIEQSRRMRSGELHYLDHPMLGIVVRITPIETWEDIDRQP